MRQYQDAKNRYPDAILFFRLGDFYEMFNDDAVVAARELQLTLTSRNKGAENPVPMAGIPYHAAHNYLAKLIAKGHKIAICEQIGDPSKLKGLVPRKVVRVLTPSLVTDGDQLDARQNNFLCAIDGKDNDDRYGFALLDLSTGDMTACALDSLALLIAEIARADPAETLLSEELERLRDASALAAPRTAVRSDTPIDDEAIRLHLDEGVAVPLFADATRDHPPEAVRAAARALRFAGHYLPEATIPVRRIAQHDADSCMHIDETAQSHLELVRGTEGNRSGTLLETIDTTVTAGGARLLRRQLLAPLMDVVAIRRRLDAVELFVSHPKARQELREALERIGDIERLAIRASLGESSPRDLGKLRDSLAAAPAALAVIQLIPSTSSDNADNGQLPVLQLQVDLRTELRALLESALSDEPPATRRESGILREGYDADLDALKSLRRDGAELIHALESRLREETKISSLKVKYTRAFGWYIEVTKTHLDKVPESWRRKQSLTTAERYATDELDELAERLIGAEERHTEREQALFEELVGKVANEAEPLRQLAAAISQWDCSAALAEIAHRNDYVRPVVDDGTGLELTDARHPVVERYVGSGQFVPNDTTLDLEGERLLIITGPNMAGKSTLMRQVSLLVIMAQMGSFVPARKAHVGMVDRVLSRVGASDNLVRGESTFMVEMRESAAILRNATRRSLVILDEIGRGTSTYDGLAIAWAIAEHLHDNVGCRAMFATHYHQLTELAELCEGIANYCVSAREHEGDIVFLHRMTAGSVNRSYGIAVARLAGLPEGVLGRAGAILNGLENDLAVERGPGCREARASSPQLGLFDPPQEPTAERTVCETLRNLSPDRMTPLEALALLAQLRKSLDNDDD